MEQTDRETIDRFCNEYSLKINMCALWPRLIENKIFNSDDVNIPLWKGKLTASDTVRDILLTIKTRGPRAFDNLILSLRETDQDNLADVLRSGAPSSSDEVKTKGDKLSTNNRTGDDAFVDDDFHENLQNAVKPLRINVRKATEFCDSPDYDTLGRYCMRSRPRGYVLIITIISPINKKKREAAERDEANLKKLFEDMGFEVTNRTDLTGANIKKVVKEFSLRDFRLIDSCFVIVSAHGAATYRNGCLDTEIEGIDYELPGAERVTCSDVIDYFSAENCKYLVGKPKIFIFQTCRGKREQKVGAIETDGFESNVPPRNYSDILVAHSTIPGHVAYRNTISGSWYIQILCEVFMNYACTMHVQDLFNLVDGRLMKLRTYDSKSQTSTVKSIGFNKHCFLNPGLFEDS